MTARAEPDRQGGLPQLRSTAVALVLGWVGVEAVDSDGGTSLWLTYSELPESLPALSPPDHEMPGRLPAAWRGRLGFVCRALTVTGAPCRNRIPVVEGVCWAHAEASA